MQPSPSVVDPTHGGVSAAGPSSAKFNLHLPHNAMAGKRIGEAAHPGPQTTLTSLGWGQSQSLGKPCPGQAPSEADSVVAQVLQIKADIVCLAETWQCSLFKTRLVSSSSCKVGRLIGGGQFQAILQHAGLPNPNVG